MSIKGVLSGFGKMAIGANRVATGIAQAVGNSVAQHPWGELSIKQIQINLLSHTNHPVKDIEKEWRNLKKGRMSL